jgi:hypothetical protein
MPPIAIRRTVRAVPIALAVAALLPASASAAPPADYVGVNAQAMVKLQVVPPERWDEFAARMAADGLRLARVDAAWSWAEPAAPKDGVHSYTWDPDDRPTQSLDRVVGLFARHGVRLVPTFTTTPAWAKASGTELAPARFGDYAAFAAAFAARYGSSGSFWAAHPELRRTPVQQYQVWTEANSTNFWTRAPNPSQYLDALRLVSPAVREADPNGAVLISIGWQDFESYVNTLYDGGLKGLIDGIGFQPYAPHAPAILDLVQRMRVVMRAHGDGALPMYITELGQPAVASGGAASATSGIVSDAARAATHSLAADTLARSDCNVRDYLMYDLVGSENEAKDGFEALMGSYRLADARPNATGRALGDVAARWRSNPTSGIVLCGGGTTPSSSLRSLETTMTATGPGCVKATVRYRGNPLEGALLRISTDHLLAEDESNAFGDAATCAPTGKAPGRWTAVAEISNVARSATYSCSASGCAVATAPPPDDPPPTSSALGFDGTLTSPIRRIDASTKAAVYSLQLQSGPQPERFSVRLAPGRFATRGPFDEGRSLPAPTSIALQGAGTLGERRQDPPPARPCSSRAHGYRTGATTIDVALPANATTTLTARYATGRQAPWVDGDYRMTFEVGPTLVGSYAADSVFAAGATGVTPATLRTAGPTPSGRTGVHLLLTTTPRATTTAGAAARRIGKRTRIAIAGQMLPAKRDRAIVIEWSHPGGSHHLIARARTDGRGRFRVGGWQPPAAGTYELWARYPKQSGGLVADRTSCPLRFKRA